MGLAPPRARGALVGHFTAVLQEAFWAQGELWVQIDLRDSLGRGPHIRADAYAALQQHHFDEIIGSYPCKNVADSDRHPRSRDAKLADGRVLHGCLAPAWLYCHGRRCAIELPPSVLDRWWPAPAQLVQLQWFGDEWRKPTVWRTRGYPALQPTRQLEGTFPSLPVSFGRIDDADVRERLKSQFTPGHSAAIAAQWGAEAVRDYPTWQSTYAAERRGIVDAYCAAGHVLPDDWAADWPSSEEATRIADAGEHARLEAAAGGCICVRGRSSADAGGGATRVHIGGAAQPLPVLFHVAPEWAGGRGRGLVLDATSYVYERLEEPTLDVREVAARFGLPAAVARGGAAGGDWSSCSQALRQELLQLQRTLDESGRVVLVCADDCYPARCHCETLARLLIGGASQWRQPEPDAAWRRGGGQSVQTRAVLAGRTPAPLRAWDSTLGFPGEGWEHGPVRWATHAWRPTRPRVAWDVTLGWPGEAAEQRAPEAWAAELRRSTGAALRQSTEAPRLAWTAASAPPVLLCVWTGRAIGRSAGHERQERMRRATPAERHAARAGATRQAARRRRPVDARGAPRERDHGRAREERWRRSVIRALRARIAGGDRACDTVETHRLPMSFPERAHTDGQSDGSHGCASRAVHEDLTQRDALNAEGLSHAGAHGRGVPPARHRASSVSGAPAHVSEGRPRHMPAVGLRAPVSRAVLHDGHDAEGLSPAEACSRGVPPARRRASGGEAHVSEGQLRPMPHAPGDGHRAQRQRRAVHESTDCGRESASETRASCATRSSARCLCFWALWCQPCRQHARGCMSRCMSRWRLLELTAAARLAASRRRGASRHARPHHQRASACAARRSATQPALSDGRSGRAGRCGCAAAQTTE